MNHICTHYKHYDLVMVCDVAGNIIATNTIDRNGNALPINKIAGVNMRQNEWFGSCLAIGGPYGGGYFSELNIDEYIQKLYPTTSGLGIDFAAPIKKKKGKQ
jgi:hypothetical protein